MIFSIQQSCLDIDYLVACQQTMLHTFPKTCFHRREILTRNGASEYLFLKYHFLFIRIRCKFHENVPKLSMTAGLLLMPAFTDCRFPNCLMIRYLRCFQAHLHLIFILQLIQYNINMLITYSIQNRLLGFLVVFQTQGRILLHHACKRTAHFILIILGIREYRHTKHRLRELNRFYQIVLSLFTQGIIGLCSLQLDNGSNITCKQLSNCRLVFPLDDKDG